MHVRLGGTGTAGDYRTCLRSKAAALAEALSGGDYDIGFLHVKAVDDTGHDRALSLKVRRAILTMCTTVC